MTYYTIEGKYIYLFFSTTKKCLRIGNVSYSHQTSNLTTTNTVVKSFMAETISYNQYLTLVQREAPLNFLW